MKEILTLNRVNGLMRIPKRWLDKNLPPGETAQILREIDGDRILITIIQPTEGTNKNETDNIIPNKTSK